MIGNHEAIHPTSDQLAAFALGRLDDSEAAPLADHLDGCETCQQAIRAVPDDSMLSLLRPSGGTPLPQSPLQGVTTCEDAAPPGCAATPATRCCGGWGRAAWAWSTSANIASCGKRSHSK